MRRLAVIPPTLALLAALPLAACGRDDPAAPVPVDGSWIAVASPLPSYQVIQGFTWNAQWPGYHLANDLVASTGDTVRAAADGRAVYAGTEVEGYGAVVLLEHRTASGTFVTLYGHLGSRAGLLVYQGDSVRAGQPIGTIAHDDEDGGPWAPHLHFGIRPGAADLDRTICGVWLYVGYSRSCDRWSHERYRAMWIDPGPAVRLPAPLRAVAALAAGGAPGPLARGVPVVRQRGRVRREPLLPMR